MVDVTYFSIRLGALIMAALLVGLWLLPDYVFFALMAGAAILGGVALMGKSIPWGIGLLLFGAGMAAIAYKIHRKKCHEEFDESIKTTEKIRRRTGDFHLDRFTEEP